MSFTQHRLALVIALALSAASLQTAQARGDIEYLPYPFQPDDALPDAWPYEPEANAEPLDGYLTQKATSHNGLQVAKVLEPALIRLLESGELNSEQIKALEKFGDALGKQPGGIGASLEQLAGSQNANLATATHNTTQHLSNQLLSTLRSLPTDDEGHVWVQGLGNGGSLDKQGGSAGMKYESQGLLLGADWALDDAWRVGVMAAKSTSNLDAQRFSANLDSWHLGGYAVRQDGPLALRLGAIYSDHAGQNKRNVNLLDYKEQLKGKYNAQSQTLFSEMGYQLGVADLSIEPFAGLGFQRYHRDSFKETGGLTALNVGAQTQQNLSSTFGLRLATLYRFDNQISLTPHLSTSWKHLYGDVDSQVRQSYRALPAMADGFTINGTSLDRNSLDLHAGLDLALSTQHTVGLTYSVQAGTNSRNQGLMGQWKMSF
ncbi:MULTISPECIES: autotransporter outer membrane beta-barrel domain-containing protein [Pseudomonas]|jgi:outer membrane autotransporter protein|uniref:Transporter n=1 Tax=Pseudomonas simiae TaxID=321846 RepID=A0A1N7UHG1_9PSED|nr:MULTISPECIES: autotransporter outer membrane beta-barrel domain-containing protein [Pseudomonas]MBD8740377.1 autotransporter outer membrane beta-barrel domain-containing protein [Pseudomonas fluorescens]PHX39325.1 transporter [Pseudomonas sp. NZIPFR-PS2]AIB39404.1 transporter [Pseudomonas simiae]AJP55174.1 outer membrane autotransporter barrel domain-containing protein [Pseudomonas simiae]MBC3962758.1 autotransporter outer membrane beta-barrel domain-containing protein [Pseudomonas simiae]